MAGSWLPRDGREFFVHLAREARMQGRRPSGQPAFEDDTAIDPSTAPDTDPLDYYVDGQDEDYPMPVVPTADDLVVDVADSGGIYDEPDDTGESDTSAEEEPLTAPVMLPEFPTDLRPDPAVSGSGAVIIDTTLGLPLFSDGTNWKTFAGVIA
jgi:hypothetical protein